MPRLVGMQVAKELVFTGRQVQADEAKELGLVHTVVGQETAMEEARAFARRFCDASPAAIGMAKTILNESYNQDFRTLLEMEAMGQSLVRETEFHREAVRRFKRKKRRSLIGTATSRKASPAWSFWSSSNAIARPAKWSDRCLPA